MSLDRVERFRLVSQIADEISQFGTGWDFQRTNLLLRNFGLPALEGFQDSPSFGEILTEANDTTLMEVAQLVLGLGPAETLATAERDRYDDNWKAGYVRMFLSHSATHKKFVHEIADQLETVGIHGFVAHESMTINAPWQEQIEGALRSMDTFVAIVHPEFGKSPWCQQEVGWALGSRTPTFVVRVGADPGGFISSTQWPTHASSDAKAVAAELVSWVAQLDELGDRFVEGVIASLADAPNYFAAEAAAKRIVQISSLDEGQWAGLNRAYWSNGQVRGGVLPSRVLEPYYHSHGQLWPPAKPLEPPF